jgi:ribosomal protein S8
MNQNLIKFLVILKNASLAKKPVLKFLYKDIFAAYVSILYKEGWIQSFTTEYNIIENRKYIIIYLRLFENKVLTENIKLLSCPSKVKNFSYNDLFQLNLTNKLILLSTSKGVKSHIDCLKDKIGGTAIFSC